MTANKTRKRQASPRTLWEAHQAVMAVRPSKAASDREWQAFRAKAAETYSAVAEVDRPHWDEALYWANSERARADRLAERMKAALARGAAR